MEVNCMLFYRVISYFSFRNLGKAVFHDCDMKNYSLCVHYESTPIQI